MLNELKTPKYDLESSSLPKNLKILTNSIYLRAPFY